jgi:hypothetical protein
MVNHPSEETLTLTIKALKEAPENLWEELKNLESRNGDLWNDTGDKIWAKIVEVNSGLSMGEAAKLQFEIRRIARIEIGI